MGRLWGNVVDPAHLVGGNRPTEGGPAPSGMSLEAARRALREGALGTAAAKVEAAAAGARPPPDRDELKQGFRTEGAPPNLAREAPPTPTEQEEPDRAELHAARRALRGVKRNRAAGPDGLSGLHIHALIRCGEPSVEGALAAAFVRYSRRFVAGEVLSDDADVRGVLGAVRLAPVPKGQSGWRPVVVPSLLSRTAGSALARTEARTVAGRLREAGQFAVGIPSGMEIIVGSVRRALEAGKAVAVLDRRHAYQSANRMALLEGLRDVGADGALAAFAAQNSAPIRIEGLGIGGGGGGAGSTALSAGSMQAAMSQRSALTSSSRT